MSGAPQAALPATTVPDSYPNLLTHTSVVTNAPQVTASVTVKNSRTPTPALCNNATVTITGGPWSITGTTLTGADEHQRPGRGRRSTRRHRLHDQGDDHRRLTKTLSSQTIDATRTTFTAQVSGTGSTC